MAKLSSSEKLHALRTLMKDNKLDGLLVQKTDLFQGEEVRACDERLAYISDFTGSAGHALILLKMAALFSDQRYSLQMKKQTDPNEWYCFDSMTTSINDWLLSIDGLDNTLIIGYDSWMMTARQVEKLPVTVGDTLIKWVGLNDPLIDQIWDDRPARQTIQHWFMPDNMAGLSAYQKISSLVTSQMTDDNSEAILISSVDSVNWLLNIRGNALNYTPYFHAMLMVFSAGSIAVITEQKPEKEIKIDNISIKHFQFNKIEKLLEMMRGKRIKIDKTSCPQGLWEFFNKHNIDIEFKTDVTLTIKSQKNDKELAGIRDAHIKDSVAFCNFWHWFEQHIQKQSLTESAVALQLSEFRAQQYDYVCDSFPSIVGFNENGAIVHYRAKKNEDNQIDKDGVLLIDSGAHYKGGTTDVTRCFAIGSPPAEALIANSLVIAAHLTLANTIFPKGTTGIQLDAICRKVLWDRSMDYGHGTGHGVGHVLSVHEGPASLSKRGSQEILKGMILSNEPGYYQENEFGVRQENLVHVVTKGKNFLGFENLTLIPFDNKLIDTNELTETQLFTLNDYHATVYKKISPYLPRELRKWLSYKCKPL